MYNIICVLLFILIVGYFMWKGAKKGINYSLPIFLKIIFPIILASGLMQLLILLNLVQSQSSLFFILLFLSMIILFTISIGIFNIKNNSYRVSLLSKILGFIVGGVSGWILFGIILYFLNYFFHLSNVLNHDFIHPILTSIEYLLFLH